MVKWELVDKNGKIVGSVEWRIEPPENPNHLPTITTTVSTTTVLDSGKNYKWREVKPQ